MSVEKQCEIVREKNFKHFLISIHTKELELEGSSIAILPFLTLHSIIEVDDVSIVHQMTLSLSPSLHFVQP